MKGLTLENVVECKWVKSSDLVQIDDSLKIEIENALGDKVEVIGIKVKEINKFYTLE